MAGAASGGALLIVRPGANINSTKDLAGIYFGVGWFDGAEKPIILREGALGADEIREVVEAFRSQRVTTDRQTDALELPGEPHPDPTAEDTQR